jgi:hypothetical protein
MHKNEKGYEQPDLYNAILHKENKNFKISEKNKNLLYTNKLKDDVTKNTTRPYKINGIDYKTNSKDFRSPEFKKNTDLLIAGCSFTYGVGIPQEFMWAEIVAKDLNLSHANLSMPADSVVGQVKKIFAYFKEYGHPKFLCALFPDFGRFLFPQNKNHFISERSLNSMQNKTHSNSEIDFFWEENFLFTSFLGSWMPDIEFSRSPHKAENILTPEISHFYSSQFILMLEQYCNLAGIKFIWSMWDVENLKIIQSLNSKEYTNVIDVNMKNWKRDIDKIKDIYMEDEKIILCHQELKEKNDRIFDFAVDRDNGIEKSHWGSHRHQHIADIIKENMI